MIIAPRLLQAHPLRGFVSSCETFLARRVWLALIDSHEATKTTKKTDYWIVRILSRNALNRIVSPFRGGI